MTYNEASYSQLTPEFKNSYKYYMNELRMEFPEVQFQSELFYFTNDYFGDYSHLNYLGALKMTKIFNTLL